MEQHQKKHALSGNSGRHGSNMLTTKLFLELRKKHFTDLTDFLAGIEKNIYLY